MKSDEEFILQVEDAKEEQKKQKRSLKMAALVFLSTVTIGTLAFFSGTSNTQSGGNPSGIETENELAQRRAREEVKKELMSSGLSLEEAEKMIDAADERIKLDNFEAMVKATPQQQVQSREEAEKMLDEADGRIKAANMESMEKASVLGGGTSPVVGNKNESVQPLTREEAMINSANLQQQVQSVYDEAYTSAFNSYKQSGAMAMPAEEENYMNYNATGDNADTLNYSSKAGYIDGKNAGITEYIANLYNTREGNNNFETSNENTSENSTRRSK